MKKPREKFTTARRGGRAMREAGGRAARRAGEAAVEATGTGAGEPRRAGGREWRRTRVDPVPQRRPVATAPMGCAVGTSSSPRPSPRADRRAAAGEVWARAAWRRGAGPLWRWSEASGGGGGRMPAGALWCSPRLCALGPAGSMQQQVGGQQGRGRGAGRERRPRRRAPGSARRGASYGTPASDGGGGWVWAGGEAEAGRRDVVVALVRPVLHRVS